MDSGGCKMTLNDLIRKANDMAMQLSSGDVPLVNYNNSLLDDVTFEFIDNKGGQRIEMIMWP